MFQRGFLFLWRGRSVKGQGGVKHRSATYHSCLPEAFLFSIFIFSRFSFPPTAALQKYG